MQKKKVCQLTSVHARYDTRIFQKISTSLADSNKDVFLIVADGKGNEVKNKINIFDIGLEQGRIKRFLFTSKQILKKALELDCEIYHFHDPELFPIALKLKKHRKKVIFDSHEYLPHQILSKEYLPKIFRKFISFLIKIYYDINIKKLDAVLSVTPHIVEDLGKNSNNAFLLTNYPIIKNVSKSISLDEYVTKNNTLYYAGTIYHISQQNSILKAIEGIDDIKYSLVGNIDEKYKQELSKFPSWKKVDFTSFVSKSELDKIAKKATIGIVVYDYTPNWGNKKGSLGVNKIFEYMLNGLPIICTDFELWKEIVDKYNCGIYVNPTSVDEIKDAINYLITNKKEAYKMGQNGKMAVRKEFNWATQEKKLFKIYNTLL